MSIFLICNAGSSNAKLAAFDSQTLEKKAHIVIEKNPAEVTQWLCAVGSMNIDAIGHRVVHGGSIYTKPTILTDEVMTQLKKLAPLAPLHQPSALKLIEETLHLYPSIPQIACFDTAFHHDLPAQEKWIPLPRTWHDQGLIRYGFHGLSYQYIASILPHYVKDKSFSRVIVAHLGSGCSACALKDYKSVATTMGFSTLDGLMMATRSGSLDPGVILYLLQEKKQTVEEISDILYHQSGLKGVSGTSGDMRELLAGDTPHAKETIDLFCYLAAKQIATLLPSLEGLDAVVFTGGIGENIPIVREKITTRLRWLGDFEVLDIHTNEELVIAQACHAATQQKR